MYQNQGIHPDFKQQSPWKSCTNLATSMANHIQGVDKTSHCLTRSAALFAAISDKFDDVITLIDDEVFTGGEKELRISFQPPPQNGSNSEWTGRGALELRGGGAAAKGKAFRGVNHAITTAVTSTNYFSKANLYANSKLPPNLPPFRVYMSTYPLICLAAQYSERVYTKPRGKEKDTHVSANWRMRTKAMVIKSVPVDDMNTIVFAIRGTQTFMDWAVNLHSEPTSPTDFLDDQGNLCHAGFLDVARKMVRPVASRLRQLLEEKPNRSSCSLLITGHSAGGAVASLLFCHMLSESVTSELSVLSGCFKRVHCITFGAPPISYLPLDKPANRERQYRKSLFISFMNEGDPVPRADRAFVKSLLELYASPAPQPASRPLPAPNCLSSTSKLNLSLNAFTGKKGPYHSSTPSLPSRPSTTMNSPSSKSLSYSNMIWPVPPATLCNAGRLVVFRVPFSQKPGSTIPVPDEEDVRAYTTTDEQLRAVVFGDPLMHQMKVYARRVEVLATKAITGRLLS
ncbi:putative lipase class 3 [Phaeomoniella chlamydospora]|uniref:Putative lipase class 3 n=1 Tax=Phaeomoniella chlamydospora TaxID=158046 RepID=A0A0G2GVR0_PHACM|nr:putative lipase class 3 [Phaeomoniella chlamydospora]